MIAGPNGSGKSTLIAALRADSRFDLPALYINADDLQRERNFRDSREAQQLANELRTQAIANRQDVIYETDQAFIFDNMHSGETGGGLGQQAGLIGDRLVVCGSTTAAWVVRLIEQVNERAAELSAWSSPQRLAWLHDNCVSGEIVFIGKHCLFQVSFNEGDINEFKMPALTLVIHDLALLGSIADSLARGQLVNICYHEGMASVE
jgi:hypothetical protein